MLDIIRSMLTHVKSQVKHNSITCISDASFSNICVRHGVCLSPFLFSTYLNGLEEEMNSKGADGVDIGMMKLFLLLYADDIVLFAHFPAHLQHLLEVLQNYCARYRLMVNTSQTKILISRKGGRIPTDLKFNNNGEETDIVKTFSYLGIVFTSGGSCHEAQTFWRVKCLKLYLQ